MKHLFLFFMFSLCLSSIGYADDFPPLEVGSEQAKPNVPGNLDQENLSEQLAPPAPNLLSNEKPQPATQQAQQQKASTPEKSQPPKPKSVTVNRSSYPASQFRFPIELTTKIPDNDSGRNIMLSWAPVNQTGTYLVYRSEKGGDISSTDASTWTLIATKKQATTQTEGFTIRDTIDLKQEISDQYWYVVGFAPDGTPNPTALTPNSLSELEYPISASVIAKPTGALFKDLPGIWFLLFLILGVGIMMYVFTNQVRRTKQVNIRRIPGIDAIEEGIGRATEMGKPVLYVPGIDSLEDIQTIASMLVLGEISKTIAEYQTDVIVSCCVPIVREVADEVVKSGFYRAGHPDSYDPTSVRFISTEQFAFCAGTNGIMYRQKPATNIYLGRFFAESLILAETGFVNKAIQIAGTAEASQLPFFIAACDYTLIGEELFAVSAYLSEDPRLVSSLKASDWIKIVIVALLALGILTMTLESEIIHDLFKFTKD